MDYSTINWLRIGANAIIAFSTAAIAVTAAGVPANAIPVGLLNAAFIGLLAFATECKDESSKGVLMPFFMLV